MRILRSHLWAYLLLVCFVVLGFFRVEQLAQEVANEQRSRAESFCLALIEQRTVITSVLEASATLPRMDIEQIKDPELRAYVEANRARQIEFLNAVAPLLQPPPCAVELGLDVDDK